MVRPFPAEQSRLDGLIRFCVFSNTLLRPFFELGHTKQLARPDSTVGIHLPYSACLWEWADRRFYRTPEA